MTANISELYEAVSAAIPDRVAVFSGDEELTYRQLDEQASRFGHWLQSVGVGPGDNVGLHLLNSVEHVAALMGCLKARAVPINVNFRYVEQELDYLYDNAQLMALVVDQAFAPAAAAVAGGVDSLHSVMVVPPKPGEPVDDDPAWPASLRVDEWSAVNQHSPADDFTGRSADDRYILYTGGTTGMPKGVVWRQEDFYYSALAGGNHYGDPHDTVESLVQAAEEGFPVTYLVTMPLIHGAASYTLLSGLLSGWTLGMQRRFDPAEVLRTIDERNVIVVAVVGDALARPLLDELRANQDAYDLSSWMVLGSGGALLSEHLVAGFREMMPNLMVRNGFGASESGIDGQLEVAGDGAMYLEPSPSVMVVDEQMRPVEPGTGVVGRLARSGRTPLGYHNAPEKTAETFPEIDGTRWVVLGDMALPLEDGRIQVLGRGSGCINTGGEKVFPEEVEHALTSHPAVVDALVAGVPDERFGQRVGAVVQLRDDVVAPTEEELREACRGMIAGYKVPRTIRFVDTVVRSPTGKADYRWAGAALREAVDA